MDDLSEDAAKRCEFLLTRAGIRVPPEMWDGVVVNYRQLCRLAVLVRGSRPPEHEPSYVFRVERGDSSVE